MLYALPYENEKARIAFVFSTTAYKVFFEFVKEIVIPAFPEKYRKFLWKKVCLRFFKQAQSKSLNKNPKKHTLYHK